MDFRLRLLRRSQILNEEPLGLVDYLRRMAFNHDLINLRRMRTWHQRKERCFPTFRLASRSKCASLALGLICEKTTDSERRFDNLKKGDCRR
jgi:hypothetical protein